MEPIQLDQQTLHPSDRWCLWIGKCKRMFPIFVILPHLSLINSWPSQISHSVSTSRDPISFWTSTMNTWPSCSWMNSKSTIETAQLPCQRDIMWIVSLETSEAGQRNMLISCITQFHWELLLVETISSHLNTWDNMEFMRLSVTSTNNQRSWDLLWVLMALSFM